MLFVWHRISCITCKRVCLVYNSFVWNQVENKGFEVNAVDGFSFWYCSIKRYYVITSSNERHNMFSTLLNEIRKISKMTSYSNIRTFKTLANKVYKECYSVLIELVDSNLSFDYSMNNISWNYMLSEISFTAYRGVCLTCFRFSFVIPYNFIGYNKAIKSRRAVRVGGTPDIIIVVPISSY